MVDLEVGKVGFSHGGLGILFFVEQPLDGNLPCAATAVKISSAKTSGEFDVHRAFVLSHTFISHNVLIKWF